LLDYSQVCVAAILAFSSDLKKGTTDDKKNLIRHVALTSIKSYKKKYSKEFGDLVIACDGRHYWRKEFFANYKGMRKKAREESDLDWGIIFDTLSEIREDLRAHFSYKVIHVDRCEADDVIAILAESTQEFGMYEPVMIVSSDKDFKQLHLNDNVKQFSPMLKKQIVVNKKELKEWMIEHIVKGDSGDGIPNILSADDVFMIGERQKSVSSKRLTEFFEQGFKACRTDEERRNWHRNETLVNFKFIPEDIKKTVMEAFEVKPTGDKNAIMNYLIKKKCRLLLNEIEEF
jgi:5'-3' exonuclease